MLRVLFVVGEGDPGTGNKSDEDDKQFSFIIFRQESVLAIQPRKDVTVLASPFDTLCWIPAASSAVRGIDFPRFVT
jgi:hypothetical protein